MNTYYNLPKAKDIFECPEFSTGTTTKDMQNTANALTRVFLNQGVRCFNSEIINGYSNTVYRFTLQDYTATQSKIKRIENSLDMYIKSNGASISFPKGEIGFTVTVPNENKPLLHLGTMLNTAKFYASHYVNTNRYTIPLGIDEQNKFVLTDLQSLPHLIIAGSTGSGKSVCINNIITSLLYQTQPTALQFVLIDPKRVELSIYQNAKSALWTPIVTETYKVYNALSDVLQEMNRRYTAMQFASCRNIDEYNEKADVLFPRIIVVIDELADLFATAKNEIQPLLIRIAQLGRAAGIHLILATQYPSCKVVTSELKANIPARICFSLPTASNSRTILGQAGAENLTGKGDGLYCSGTSSDIIRFQCPIVTSNEIQNLINYMEEQK